jgi:hypothetical protein
MIYAIMIVGPDEADRYLSAVMERTARWADRIHVALEPGCGTDDFEIVSEYAESVQYLKISAAENEGMAKNEAWLDMQHAFQPQDVDLIAFVKPTEVVMNPEAIRKAAREYLGFALTVRVFHLWDSEHIRIDGAWHPKDELLCVPWRRGASYPDYRLRVGRLPTYHFNAPTHGVPVTELLDHDMMTFDDKLRKWDWFEAVGASDFYSIDHVTSIKRSPTLRIWKKGGVLNARRQEATI